MRLPIAILSAAFSCLLALTGAAAAHNAFTTGGVNMRVAPGVKYPRITTIPAHAAVTVHGCTANWRWCDTSWWHYRGWVSAKYLQTTYFGPPRYLPHYGPRIGVPIIVFRFGPYWDRWYHGRPVYRNHPWYHDRTIWEWRWHHHW
jgi:uncharacterized protein YraI